MQKEDYNSMKGLENILEQDLQKEMAKINTAGTINPTQIETLNDAVCLMLKLKEYEQWIKSPEGEEEMMKYYSQYGGYNNGYVPPMPMSYNPYYTVEHSPTGWSHHMPPAPQQMTYGYYNNTSNHSTKDRMISRLEDMMGDAKNEYEAKMIRDAITYIQSN